MRLVDHQENKKPNGFEVYMLLEYCPNGTLFDLIEQKCRGGFSGITDEDELIKIVNEVSKGLKGLHEKSISHRDLKIENILKGQDGNWKICDLGSSTTRQFNTAMIKKDKIEIIEEIEKMTTPIYRAPEQLDLFSGFNINQKVDIWALGCITYTLMYHKPPFEEGQKLS